MRKSDSLLPRPVATSYDWQLRGACREGFHPLYFSSGVESTRTPRKRESRAKELCTACPVLAECRRHALTGGEEHGVWGGMTALERRDALRAAARGVGGARYERGA